MNEMRSPMIPLSDDNSLRRSIPIVTYVLILLNVLFFFLEMAGGEAFVKEWAFIPSRFLANPIANIPTLFTSMFMHAGIAHIAGNMLYLWIFGDNVEDVFGKFQFAAFYLICGIAATFAQLMASGSSDVPNVGASGAIAGVLGAYIFMWPQGKVNVLFGRSMTQMSALIVIGFWFLMQFVSGMGSLYSTNDEGGVAYFAHIGGFIAGLAIAFIATQFKRRQ
jgi:membrane associated rhomboid family serine protease